MSQGITRRERWERAAMAVAATDGGAALGGTRWHPAGVTRWHLTGVTRRHLTGVTRRHLTGVKVRAIRRRALRACEAVSMDQDARSQVPGADLVRLVLPAEPDYGRIARIAASSIALRLAWPFSAIEDLRLAVDETIILLLRPEGGPGEITVEFTIEPDRLIIDASTTAGRDQHWLDAGAGARFDDLVGETVDSHEIDEAHRHVHLVKRHPA